MKQPDSGKLRLAAQRLRQVAKVSKATVDKIPGAALILEGDAESLADVADWLENCAENPPS